MKEDFVEAIINQNGCAHCMPKSVEIVRRNNDDVATKTITMMGGTSKNGVYAVKSIVIDDELKTTDEEFVILDKNNVYKVKNGGLTRFRCAQMTVLAIEELFNGTIKSVGFIGCGQTNIANAIAIQKRFNVENAVIRGSKNNYAKNVGDFMTIFDNVMVDSTDDMHLLNECDVVVTCTSSCDKNNVIEDDFLKKVSLIVSLDCGYILGESFRKNRISYTDWTDQIYSHYKDEFPFDKDKHKFIQLCSCDCQEKTDKDKMVVYLYGVSISDAVAAEKFMKGVHSSGTEKDYLLKK